MAERPGHAGTVTAKAAVTARVTQIMRTQEKLLNIASIEGAFHTDMYALARSERGVQALMGLIPESFQGTEDVVTGVQCRDLAGEEQAYIRKHAAVFTPSRRGINPIGIKLRNFGPPLGLARR